jgi:putative transposase
MGRRHFKTEQIIHMLREAEIKLAGGKTTAEVCRELGISEQSDDRCRKEYGVMQVSQAKKLKDLERENALTRAIVDLANEYGRYGYRRITALLRHQGWHVNHKRVERIWHREGLKIPQKQMK